MSHHKRYHKTRCKYHTTFENELKKIHPGRPEDTQGKVTFCEELRAYPIGRKLKRRCK